MKNNQAFTLIELLVVVLIISILAAVALPQYQLAVDKTRFASLRSTTEPLIKAAQTYYLESGTWPTKFEELSVDLPAGFTITNAGEKSSCGTTQDMFCCLISESGWNMAITCGRTDETFSFYHMFADNTDYCVAKLTDSQAIKLCSPLGTALAGWTAFFPMGTKPRDEYISYKIK